MAESHEAAREVGDQEGSSAVFLTEEGFAALQAELEHLTLVKRPEIAERIRESQEHGEFSEDNNELDEVKFEQAIVENRIAELKTLFGNAQVLDPKAVPTDYVGIGSLVSLLDEEFGDEFEVRVVTGVEADPARDWVSNESPMGTALLGKSKGQSVVVEAPDGKHTFKISAIRR
jgi:transcription elongation factor GreA